MMPRLARKRACRELTVTRKLGLQKEEMLDHVQRLGLPYTVIDVGWWYQISLPRVASGRFDYALLSPIQFLLGGGEVPSALTDLRDVGMYVAKIISDERTLNKKVLAYTEVKTQNEIFELVEKKTGEKPEVIPVSNPTDRSNAYQKTTPPSRLIFSRLMDSRVRCLARSWTPRSKRSPTAKTRICKWHAHNSNT